MDALWPDDVSAVTALLARDSETNVDELLSFLDASPAPLPTAAATRQGDATSSDSRSETSASPSRSVSPTPSTLKTASPKRERARGGSAQMKRSLETLRAEVQALQTELEQLQSHSRSTRSAAMERALAERFKRRRAETERQQLRDAVLTQKRFVRGLRSVFSSPPSFVSGLNMCHFLHNYTRLPRDHATREREYAALATETRLRHAMDILVRETESLTISDDYDTLSPSLAEPFIQTEMNPDAGGFGVTTTSVFALEIGDVGAVLRGACLAACDLMPTCPAYPTTGIQQRIVDPHASPADFLYRAMDVSYTSLDQQDALAVASRGLTICKQTPDEAVVVWDFIDDDELHPMADTTDITRQAVGACLIRREICADGRERTVYRALSTRRYRYHPQARRDVLERYYLDSRRRMRTNELLFREILKDAIAEEHAANATARCRRELVPPA